MKKCTGLCLLDVHGTHTLVAHIGGHFSYVLRKLQITSQHVWLQNIIHTSPFVGKGKFNQKSHT